VRGEKLSDAVIYNKMYLLKKDFFGYIEKNTAKVDANLPVFFGYVVSALENSFPDIADESYDDFIDSITFKVLDVSTSVNDFEYVKKVILNALRLKKRKDADMGINIVVGLKLLKIGDFAHALEYLRNYWNLDIMLGAAVAHCYYTLSRREFTEQERAKKTRPGEMELLAREKMLELSRKKPPLHKVPQLELEDTAFLDKIFWQMIFLSLEWFPSEAWFVTVGLEKAKISNNIEMKKRLLEIGSEQFYNDINFLREMYYFKLDSKDAGGAAGVVNQLIKQYPDNLEPVFLGLKLSLLTTKKITYHSFRKLALTKGMPAHTIELFDFAFDLLNKDTKEALGHLSDIEKNFPWLEYYVITLRYLAKDFFSDDETRQKMAKKALLDSIEKYCVEVLRTKEPLR
jgi:tetratricopeptide (TPR) repeat protein